MLAISLLHIQVKVAYLVVVCIGKDSGLIISISGTHRKQRRENGNLEKTGRYTTKKEGPDFSIFSFSQSREATAAKP